MPPVPRITLGPIDALERAFARDIAELQGEDKLRPVMVLTGETLLRAYLRRRLAELNGAHVNIHILTPGELALRLGELPRILRGERPLPLLADRVLAHEAALETDSYFDAVRETPGFAAALHRTLVELRRAAVAPGELAAAASETLEPEKVAALAALAERHDALRAGYYDADASLAAA